MMAPGVPILTPCEAVAVKTAWGTAVLVRRGGRVCGVGPPRKNLSRTLIRRLETRHGPLRWASRSSGGVPGLLRAYFEGEPVDFRAADLDYGAATSFQIRVYEALRRIPFGQVLTYGALAGLAGAPRAARACGSCMAANAIPVIVPCHRVVRADSQPGRYSAPGGAAYKLRLLRHEGLRILGGRLGAGALGGGQGVKRA